MESIFDTYTFEEAVKEGICGPSFVCVYVGQKSKHLDFVGSDYENDGFDIQCDSNGGIKATLPKDFTNNSEDYENDVAVFKVGYSQQNQNIFKDITLDQSEFTETEESLKIIDDISKTGSENQRHFGGQNLYSVYGVRSYKAEVEMMGNAMIQPMMYFQLDNIPMFHGAYLITHVKHSIVPNSMSTNFTGVRVRHPETPILDAAELYMSLLQNIEITATITTPSSPTSSGPTFIGPAGPKCATLATIPATIPEIINKAASYWTLIAVASIEGGAALQDKADVAQSIYNRYISKPSAGGGSYGTSIQGIILASGQYVAINSNRSDWDNIDTKEKAINAVYRNKGGSIATNRNLIEKTISALSNPSLQQEAINFIGSRTEFLSNYSNVGQTNIDDKCVVERSLNSGLYNAFFWGNSGKRLRDKGIIPVNLYNMLV